MEVQIVNGPLQNVRALKKHKKTEPSLQFHTKNRREERSMFSVLSESQN